MPKKTPTTAVEIFSGQSKEDNETPEEHWNKLITLEKNCDFKNIKQEDLLISKFITSTTDKKLRENLSVKRP